MEVVRLIIFTEVDIRAFLVDIRISFYNFFLFYLLSECFSLLFRLSSLKFNILYLIFRNIKSFAFSVF